MNTTDVFDRAVAFHYRHCARERAIPWQPTRDPEHVWPALGIVVLYTTHTQAAYAFRVTAQDAVRFRALPPIDSLAAYTRLAQRATRALSGQPDPDKAAPLLAELGLSTREVGSLLGVSHEGARRKAQGL